MNDDPRISGGPTGAERAGMAVPSWPDPQQVAAARRAADPAASPTARRPLWREGLELLGLTLVIAVGIQLGVQSRLVEGHSMEPTLHDHQRLLISRVAYGGFSDPQRGDIVVFHAWDSEEDYIKRVIGVPGDTIEIRESRVMVNGVAVDEPYLRSDKASGNQGPIVLGADDFYVMGDNRGNSSDSRLHGALNRSRIVGKAWICYWPLQDLGLVSDSSAYAANP
jgi:signal peptidase I